MRGGTRPHVAVRGQLLDARRLRLLRLPAQHAVRLAELRIRYGNGQRDGAVVAAPATPSRLLSRAQDELRHARSPGRLPVLPRGTAVHGTRRPARPVRARLRSLEPVLVVDSRKGPHRPAGSRAVHLRLRRLVPGSAAALRRRAALRGAARGRDAAVALAPPAWAPVGGGGAARPRADPARRVARGGGGRGGVWGGAGGPVHDPRQPAGGGGDGPRPRPGAGAGGGPGRGAPAAPPGPRRGERR